MSAVRGWCPSAHRPMASGDGLLVRIKPRLGQLSAGDLLTLTHLADRHGNGVIDLTSRANLQIRGVTEDGHSSLLAELVEAGLVDADPVREERRNIAVTPFWTPGDLTERLHSAILARLDDLPDLPGKMGIALDTGPRRMLTGVPADFRFEPRDDAPLILRADGSPKGVAVTEETAVDALIAMAEWFAATGGREAGRMARHLERTAPPSDWTEGEDRQDTLAVGPGAAVGGRIVGVPFGQTDAGALAALVNRSGASHLRVLPWRTLFLENAAPVEVEGFLSSPDPLLDVTACPGAPACAEAQIETHAIARTLAGKVGTLHVSGCSKGCARQTLAEVTLVGNRGRFDLVRNGRAGDTPERAGLTAREVEELFA